MLVLLEVLQLGKVLGKRIKLALAIGLLVKDNEVYH